MISPHPRIKKPCKHLPLFCPGPRWHFTEPPYVWPAVNDYTFVHITLLLRIMKNPCGCTHATPEDVLIYRDNLMDDKAKLATTENLTTTIVNRLFKALGLVISFFCFYFLQERQSCPASFNWTKCSELMFFFRIINEQTKCPVIQTFDQTKPICDRTKSSSELEAESSHQSTGHHISRTGLYVRPPAFHENPVYLYGRWNLRWDFFRN